MLLRQLLSEVQARAEPEGSEPAEDFTVLGTSPYRSSRSLTCAEY